MSKTIKKQDAKQIAVNPNNVAVKEEDILSPELMKLLEEKVPSFVKEYVADGSAILRWNHELLIMFLEILRLNYGWSEEELEGFEKKVKEMLPVVHTMKMEDTKLMRKYDFWVAKEIVERNKVLFKMEQAGIKLPDKVEVKSLKEKK